MVFVLVYTVGVLAFAAFCWFTDPAVRRRRLATTPAPGPETERIGEPMNDTDVCTCGDVRDEHGHDPDYPGSTACTRESCDCLAFELAEPADPRP